MCPDPDSERSTSPSPNGHARKVLVVSSELVTNSSRMVHRRTSVGCQGWERPCRNSTPIVSCTNFHGYFQPLPITIFPSEGTPPSRLEVQSSNHLQSDVSPDPLLRSSPHVFSNLLILH